MREPERIAPRRAALIAYDVCRRALTPSDTARRAVMRPVLEAWVQMIAAAHAYSLDKAMKMYARIRGLAQVKAMLRD